MLVVSLLPIKRIIFLVAAAFLGHSPAQVCAVLDEPKWACSNMDARQQPAPPFTRPPDRSMIHNPNHHPPTAHAYPPPSTQQAAAPPLPPQQGQQPLHVPFSTSTDPYATARRDPFFPQRSNHVRQRSHGAPDAASQAHHERNGGWGNTGTHTGRVPLIARARTALCRVQH